MLKMVENMLTQNHFKVDLQVWERRNHEERYFDDRNYSVTVE